ncbi:MAG: hypothetical protein JJ896_15925 [Rhodothermales bacterium]|nr:hypothetical protein [Rhodothermales bacterium]MBO6781143.1 hypothetical protein [Rhodothermales bacterium]
MRILLLVFFSCLAWTAGAHPWGGLVVDAAGSIYFTFVCPVVSDGHTACVWRLAPGAAEPEPVLVASSDPSDLVLTRDRSRQIYAAERVGSHPFRTRLWRFAADGTAELILPFLGPDQFNADPYSVDESGVIRFQHDGALWQRTPDGPPQREADAPDRFSNLLVQEGLRIHVTRSTLVRDGRVVSQALRLEDPPEVPFAGANILFDVAADDSYTYLAYYGNREVLRVSEEGIREVILEADSPWSPSGVDVFEGTVYVLESVTPAPAWKFWQDSTLRPRIRRVNPDGEVRTLWEYELD